MANRDRRLEVEWRRIIRGHIRSGLSVREFCAKSKLPESAFYYWRRELHRRQAEQEQPRGRHGPVPAFVPVRVAANRVEPVAHEPEPASPGRIEIVLPSGRRVHVIAPVDRQALADVLAVLEA
jgi:transposase-like protein